MNKKKLLYASPFPPMKSGISDYSVILVQALSRLFDITLLIEDYDIESIVKNDYNVLRYGVDEVDFDNYDYILYNMGNNATFHSYIYKLALVHPGYIIWHDLSIFHFIYEYYNMNNNSIYVEMYERFGLKNFIELKKAIKNQELNLKFASEHPLLEEIFATNNKYIVHSHFSKSQMIARGKKSSDIEVVNMIAQVESKTELIDRDKLLKQFNIPTDAMLICSFGYIQENKLNHVLCNIIKELSEDLENKICYVMVGSGNYVDHLLEDNLIIKTGYTELQEFDSFINYADIVVNLRNPTMGETSAALMRAMEMAKPTIISNHGWYAELPDDATIKISIDDSHIGIKDALTSLINNSTLRHNIGTAASKYIERECSAEYVTDKIYKYIINNK